MHKTFDAAQSRRTGAIFAALSAALALAACGGSGDNPTASTQQFTIALPEAAASLPVLPAELVAQPSFHLAPTQLDTPDDSDAPGDSVSALQPAHLTSLSAAQASVATSRLTLDAIQSSTRMQALAATTGESATPFASSSAVTTYTPAQIRAAYGLSTLPAVGAALSASQAAQLGAGQTIYIVDALHDPNVAAELTAFNQKFGLSACTSQAIATTATLPLASAKASDGCTLSVVYSTTSGTMSSTAPAYDSGWATEIALDVQWAHAIAPQARIVLIEAPDASLNSLLAAIRLANAMGPGIVSMSFGASEGSWTSSVDSAFTGTGMSYLAATGDSGAAVAWPSVSTKVLAVGGTTLSASGTSRSEVAWSGTGGGLSAYVATPSYQTSQIPGVGSLARRSVADVAFNANPSTGQYVALIPKGSTATSWVSAGGTSLSTPQWAGLLAIANALRVQAGKAVLGAPHSQLYGLAASSTTYASLFADITSGSDGTCATCTARTGYDPLTGLGTPNATSLISALVGSATTVTASAPVVSSATVNGTAGTALSYKVAVTSANAVSYALTGAPSGMAIASDGTVSWAKPVAGSYAVTVTAKDSKTALSGQGVLTVVIASASTGTSASQAPTITANALSGVAGKPLTGAIGVSNAAGGSLSISITGIPSGVQLSLSGQTITLYWPSPVTGSYKLAITARNSAGLTSQASLPITITAK